MECPAFHYIIDCISYYIIIKHHLIFEKRCAIEAMYCNSCIILYCIAFPLYSAISGKSGNFQGFNKSADLAIVLY